MTDRLIFRKLKAITLPLDFFCGLVIYDILSMSTCKESTGKWFGIAFERLEKTLMELQHGSPERIQHFIFCALFAGTH